MPPPKGELSEDAKGRSGIPVVCLKGDEQGKLTDEMATALRAERPGRIPHEVVDLSALWAEVTGDRPDLPPDWQQPELYRTSPSARGRATTRATCTAP